MFENIFGKKETVVVAEPTLIPVKKVTRTRRVKRFTKTTFDEAMKRVKKEGVPAVAKDMGVSEGLLYTWRKLGTWRKVKAYRKSMADKAKAAPKKIKAIKPVEPTHTVEAQLLAETKKTNSLLVSFINEVKKILK